jgi:hypothetical protein
MPLGDPPHAHLHPLPRQGSRYKDGDPNVTADALAGMPLAVDVDLEGLTETGRAWGH